MGISSMTHSALGLLLVSGAALGASCQAAEHRDKAPEPQRTALPLTPPPPPDEPAAPSAERSTPLEGQVDTDESAGAPVPAAAPASSRGAGSSPGQAPPAQLSGASKYENLLAFCKQAAYFRSNHLWPELHALASAAEQQRVAVQKLEAVFSELDEVGGTERVECVTERVLDENDAKSPADIEPLKNAMLPLRFFFKDRGSTSLQIWTVAYGAGRWETDFSDL
jgi:hypothetical protein